MSLQALAFKSLSLSLILAACCGLAAAQVAPSAQGTQTEAILETLARAQSKTDAKEWGEAAALWEKAVAANPVNGSFWNNLAMAHYNAKDYRRAITAYEKVGALGDNSPANIAYNIACSYALLGEKEAALKWLEKSVDLGFADLRHVQTDTDLNALHDDARFKQLVGLVDTSKMSREEGWRHDLQLLAREVKRKAYATFHKSAATQFGAAVKKLHDSIPRLTDSQIIIEFAKLMRMVGDGHSGLMSPGARPEFALALPVQFYLFEEGLFIIAADPKYKDLLGAQVLRFGDRTVEEVMRGLEPITNRDNDIWLKQVGPHRMRTTAILNALGLIPEAQQVTLTIRNSSGETRAVSLVADASATNIWNVVPKTWISLPQTASAPVPLYLKNVSARYWFEYLPEAKTVYFQFNIIRNDPNESLEKFSDRLFKFVNENGVEKLVVDMRWNNGGNTTLLRPLIQGLVRNEKINKRGKLFVIIGRRTFSAAQNAATYIERDTNATFVGEPTGSSPNFVGEEDSLTLPYSKVVINVSDLYWQSSSPFDHRTWIAPQIYTPPTFEAYRANRDSALEVILAYRENR